MRWLKWVFAIVVLAGLGTGVYWAADLGGSAQADTAAPPVDVEQLLANRSGLSVTTIHRMERTILGVVGDKAQAKGLLNQTQAANLANIDVTPILNESFNGVAQAAGVSGDALFNDLANGQSLAQVAQGAGVSRDALKTNLTNLAAQELQTKANGVVDSSQAAALVGLLQTNIDKLIDLQVPQHHHGAHARPAATPPQAP